MPDPQPVAAAGTDRFAPCLAEVLRHEGGFVDNPLDPGGATNLGITRRTLAAWRQVTPWRRLPVGDVSALGRLEAAEIYRNLYWDRCNAGALPAGLDLSLFDFAVNSGPGRAIKTLQRQLGVVVDGYVGPLTLAAIRRRVALAGVAGLIIALCNGRLGFLQRLAISATFGAGWNRRVADIRAAALKAAGPTAAAPSTTSSPAQKGNTAMNFLAGYKTYIVGALMVLTGLAQLLGVAIPAFGGQSAGDLLMQGLAIVFLRQGITNSVAKS